VVWQFAHQHKGRAVAGDLDIAGHETSEQDGQPAVAAETCTV